MSITTVLTCLVLLQIKHLIADFIIQPESWFSTKSQYSGRGGILHAAVHAALTFVVLLVCAQGLVAILFVSLIEGVIHHFIDWCKASMVDREKLTTQHKRFWWFFGIDQALHHLTYIGIVWWLYAYSVGT